MALVYFGGLAMKWKEVLAAGCAAFLLSTVSVSAQDGAAAKAKDVEKAKTM